MNILVSAIFIVSATTANLQLPEMSEGQANKHISYNEAVSMIDALLNSGVESAIISEPSGTTDIDGKVYIVPASATGEWLTASQNDLAHYYDGDWHFYTPKEGWRVWLKPEDITYVFNGAAWSSQSAGGVGSTTDHGTLTGLTDDDHVRYVDKSPGTVFRNLIQSTADGVIPLEIEQRTGDAATDLLSISNSSYFTLFSVSPIDLEYWDQDTGVALMSMGFVAGKLYITHTYIADNVQLFFDAVNNRLYTGGALQMGGNITSSTPILYTSSTTQFSMPLPRMTTAQRNALPNVIEGGQVWNNQTHRPQIYSGTRWYDLPTTPAD